MLRVAPRRDEEIEAEGAEAEAHDDDTVDEALAVRQPLHRRRRRARVHEAGAQPEERAVAEQEGRERRRERAEEVGADDERRAEERREPLADAQLQPAAREHRHRLQQPAAHEDPERVAVREVRVGQAQIRRGVGRHVAPTVDGADAEVHAEAGEEDDPAVVEGHGAIGCGGGEMQQQRRQKTILAASATPWCSSRHLDAMARGEVHSLYNIERLRNSALPSPCDDTACAERRSRPPTSCLRPRRRAR